MLYPPTLYVKLTLPLEASCGDRYAYDSLRTPQHLRRTRVNKEVAYGLACRGPEIVATAAPQMRKKRCMNKRRTALITGGLVLVTAAGLLAYVTRQRKDPQPARTVCASPLTFRAPLCNPLQAA